MPRSKKNLESFLSRKTHNPPERFIYEEDGYIIYVDLLEGKTVLKPSTSRVMRISEVKLVIKWVNENELGSWSEWRYQTIPIIQYFYITNSIRERLYSIFRESTLSKLKKSIKEIEKLILNTESYWENLIEERHILRDRLSWYNSLYQKLMKERTGHNKFLYPIIRPLFTKLESKSFNTEKQCRIVCSLFELANFDNFKDSIEIYDDGYKEYDIAMKQIRKIRSSAFKESFL